MDEQGKKKTWKPRPRYMGKNMSINREKGYGFIQSDHDGESYFFQGNRKELLHKLSRCGVSSRAKEKIREDGSINNKFLGSGTFGKKTKRFKRKIKQ